MLPARSGLDLRALRTTVYTGGVTAKLTDEDWASQHPTRCSWAMCPWPPSNSGSRAQSERSLGSTPIRAGKREKGSVRGSLDSDRGGQPSTIKGQSAAGSCSGASNPETNEESQLGLSRHPETLLRHATRAAQLPTGLQGWLSESHGRKGARAGLP